MGLSEADRLCIPVPMYHCFGMVLGSLLCTACGAAMVLPSAGFDADAMLDAVESEGCTAVHGVPTMFIAALEAQQARRRRLDTLRTGIMAGAPCPEELMHRVMTELNVGEITIAYGMTETGPLSTQTLPADPVALRVATVGRVLPHTAGEDRRQPGPHRAGGRDRRALHPGLQRDVGILGRRAAHARGHRRRLDVHRRPGHAGRMTATATSWAA
jgi:acyl-CoA synthetase (AMP-forming)/AMP-acid ligase II